MKKIFKKHQIIALMMCVIFTFTNFFPSLVQAKEENISKNYNIKESIDKCGKAIIKKYPNLSSEWFALGLSRANINVPENYYDNYYNNLKSSLQYFSCATDLERTILGLNTIGKDASNIDGVNLIEKLWNFENVNQQGLNGPVFALLALDSKHYEEPLNAINTRENLVKEILKYKTADGGFSLGKGSRNADIDMTAMALQALSNYTDNKEVNDCIESSLKILSKKQLDNGGFTSRWSGENVQSAAQVIVALTSLGKDIMDPSNGFIKSNGNLMSYVLTYQNENGLFEHPKGVPNVMATEQAMYSIVAYDRFTNGKIKLYDMTDAKDNKDNTDETLKNQCLEKYTLLIKKIDDSNKYTENEYTTESLKSLKDIINETQKLIDNLNTEKIKNLNKDEINILIKQLNEKIDLIDAVINNLKLKPKKGKITLSVERRVLGQPDIISPTDIEINVGDRVSVILDEILKDKKIDYQNTGTLTNSFYLSSINVNGEDIGEFDHGTLSGWMYSVNGVRPNIGMADKYVQDGDVIRIHYTCKAFGQDIDCVDKIFELRNKVEEAKKYKKEDYSEKSFENLCIAIKNAEKDIPSDEEIGKLMSTTLANSEDNQNILFSKSFIVRDSDPGEWVVDEDVDLSKLTNKFINHINKINDAINNLKENTDNLRIQCLNMINILKDKMSKASNYEETKYTEETFKILKEAINNGNSEIKMLKEIFNSYDKQQLENELKKIEKCIKELDDAMKNLKEKITTESIDVNKQINESAEWILNNCKEPGYTNEWYILGLTRGNIEVPTNYYEKYYNNIEEQVKKQKANFRKVTDLERIILAVASIGKDPLNVGGYNLIDKLFNYKNIMKQGLNGPVFALIALDTKGYDEPLNALNTRDKLIEEIMKYKTQDNGFSLFENGKKADVDMTAMTIQALSNYTNRDDVNKVVQSSIELLSKIQLDNGGYNSEWSGENVQSTAQVIVALTSLGKDIMDPSNGFVKSNGNLLSYLKTYQNNNGAFEHPKGIINGMATEQALYSLVSYKRFTDKKSKLYDMKDVVLTDLNIENEKNYCINQLSILKKKIEDLKDFNEDEYTEDSYNNLKSNIDEISKNINTIEETIDSESNIENIESIKKCIESCFNKLENALNDLKEKSKENIEIKDDNEDVNKESNISNNDNTYENLQYKITNDSENLNSNTVNRHYPSKNLNKGYFGENSKISNIKYLNGLENENKNENDEKDMKDNVEEQDDYNKQVIDTLTENNGQLREKIGEVKNLYSSNMNKAIGGFIFAILISNIGLFLFMKKRK